MQKKKRWQQWLIIIVIALTVYNILPTVFYYSKSLKKPVDRKKSESIATNIKNRVNSLEKDSVLWLKSYLKMIKTKPRTIEVNKTNPYLIDIDFLKNEDASKFKQYVRRAGNLISFVPSQLTLVDSEQFETKKVTIKRQIPIRFDANRVNDFFEYTSKYDDKKNISSFYKEIIFDRTSQIGSSVAGVSENAILLENILEDPFAQTSKNIVFSLVHNILDFTKVFGENSPITNRFFASFTQGHFDNPKKAVQTLIDTIARYRAEITLEKSRINQEEKTAKFVSDDSRQKMYLLDKRATALINAENILKNNIAKFSKFQKPLTYNDIYQAVDSSFKKDPSNLLKIDLKANNPFVSQIIVDFSNSKLFLTLHRDISRFENSLKGGKKDLFDQLLINEIARLSTKTDEKIMSEKDEFSINLHTLENTSGYLVLNLNEFAKVESKQILNTLLNDWHPTHPDLDKEALPIYDFDTYKKLSKDQKEFCLVVFVPTLSANQTPTGMHSNSIYIIAKGLDKILQKYQSHENTADAKNFFKDFNKLKSLLTQNGYLGFDGALLGKTSGFSNAFVFEKDDYYQTILNATRENFEVHGSKQFATLELSTFGQRILTLNKIETSIQEDLLKWKDDYNAAQINLDASVRYDYAPPTKNPLLSNIFLSFKKYFRGDERKILNWGLDLSGGKTVQIELRDQNNRIVKDDAALKQGMNELYNRVNKMGVSEVNIRTIDSNIVLDFPGAQGLSAKELVKASSMSFHITNEKFSLSNSSLSEHVNKFLQEVYNEAVVTNKKDLRSLNALAYKHLHGKSITSESIEPVSESAKILYDNGLRLASLDTEVSSAFNDTISKIAMFKGSDASDWHGQTNPLLIVFNNYALEGSSLTNIRSAYDPSQGNFLTFEVKSAYTNKEGVRINPREEIHNWTSQFSKDKIAGTPLETFSKGQGWRMAVILNDYIISAPTLHVDIKDSAQITGGFSLREINQLTADLKAGSLSFTPHILSEKNVSPELGSKERIKGIIATFVALILVVGAMIYYYKFAGLIASIAVLFNLLIMWATLQNLHATLSLASIAGIILTVGMAVDANVLVFERIKEEFAITKRISSAIQNGYKKAFSAIFDSNITTIIAALVLLNFDSGPIKGFALTLIIGIVSSMFTALFMTRYFFTKWAKNPKHTNLHMLDFVKIKTFNFPKFSKYVIIVSSLIILVGSYTFAIQKKSVFGMDFTGGFALSVEVDKKADQNYRNLVEKALVKSGVRTKDFQIRELSPSNNLRILLSASLDKKGSAFYNMPYEIDVLDASYSYETNPRIVWVVNTLKESGIQISSRSLEKLDQNWTLMSGQMSDAMRNNAIWGLGLALIAILIYITFRFEFKFAISAMICLIHDVVVTLAIVSILHLFRVPIQIDLHTIAALMTIIGYSLNDTIVIFDRIREDLKHMKKSSLKEIINHSLSRTLSRTTITSVTTILALLALVILGGSTIFSFALVMTIGVIFGTLSSIFIASPLMLMFHKMEVKKSLTLKNFEK